MLNAITTTPQIVRLAGPAPAPPNAGPTVSHDRFCNGMEKGSEGLLTMVSQVGATAGGIALAWGGIELLHRFVPVASYASFGIGIAGLLGGMMLGGKVGTAIDKHANKWMDQLGNHAAKAMRSDPAGTRGACKTLAAVALSAPLLVPFGLMSGGMMGMGAWVLANGVLAQKGIIKV